MDNLLFVSIIVSLLINLFLFIYLYKKKSFTRIKDGFIESSIDNSSAIFSEALTKEISRVERYEDYSFCLVSLKLESCPSRLQNDLRTFVRKSDSVYVFDNTVYIIFPFLQVDDSFKDKINKKLVEYIKINYNNIELLDVDIEECTIHKMININQFEFSK